jgi:hypothetical protein
VLSVLTLPVAIYLTRYVEGYDLIDAWYAIPVGLVLGAAAVVSARRASRVGAIRLGRERRDGIVVAGRLLGIVGICIALVGVVSLVVYGLLEYAGNT